MGMMDKQVEKQRQTIQSEVPEPVIAYSILSPAGYMGAYGLERVSPALAMLKRRKAQKAAGDLSHSHGILRNRQTWVALTADKVYALDGKVSGYSAKIVGKLAEWRREDVKVTLQRGKVTMKVTFDVADGGHYELETSTIGSYNDDFLNELATMSRA